MQVFIAGGSGVIGRRLVHKVTTRGDEAVVLTRDRQRAEAAGIKGKGISLVKGDSTFLHAWRESIAGSGVVVNLAGEGLFERRWDEEFKRKVRATRIETTKNIVAAIGNAPSAQRPKVLVNASAVGFYGSKPGDDPLSETARPGDDFVAKLCVEWEEAARMASAYGTRVVVVRIGIVLSPDGGALPRMAGAFKAFVGGAVGDGTQWFSWVHVDDVVGLILYAIDRAEVRGPVNATAPVPVRAGEFASALGKALGRPSWLNVPRALLRLRYGEGADIIASGQRVVPTAALEHGYIFRYREVGDALADLVGKGASSVG